MTVISAQSKLANQKISKLVLSYLLTTLSALAVNSVYTLVDSLFVSWGVGYNAMGGISIVLPFILLQSAIATALGGGAASIISRKIGASKFSEGGNIAVNAMIFFWITAICTTILGFIFMEPMLNAMGITPELHEYAKDYFTIILIGNIFSTGFSSIIRAEGKMRYALLIWVIPIMINITLDAVFILLLGWGVKGSAYATIACQFASFSMSILFFTKYSILNFKGVKLKIETIKQIFSIGLPALVQSLVFSLSLMFINNVLKYTSGTLAINTFAYINKIIMFATIPFIAIMQAISPIIGYNYGAKNNSRVMQTVKFSIFISIIYSLIALALLEIAPKYFMMIFTDNLEIINLGISAIRIVAVSLPFTPLAIIIGATYQAVGNRNRALLMYSINIIIFIPCVIIFNKLAGLSGIWWSYAVSHMLTMILGLLLFKIFLRKFNNPLYKAVNT